MNIIFFGSSKFALPSLGALLSAKHKVSSVVTQPDKQKGRGLYFAGTEIKSFALDAGLKIFQPKQINSQKAINFLRELNPDLFVVVAYGQILSQAVLDIPKNFAINLHASLLPKYRGAAPINWAIIKGEKTTGVTVIKMAEGMDAGPILLQKAIDIDGRDNALTLEDKLSKIGPDLLISSLDSIENNKFDLKSQNESLVTFAPRLKKEDGLIDWTKDAQEIYNLIRGCLGWPGAFTYYNGKILKLYDAQDDAQVVSRADISKDREDGQITQVLKDGIIVATGNGNLKVKELQIEGKRRMKVEEFICGHKISIGEILGKK